MLHNLVNESLFVKKIDYILLVLITFLLISLTFASSMAIGMLAAACFLVFILKLILKKDVIFSFGEFDKQIFFYIAVISFSVLFSSLFLPSLKGYLKILTYVALYLTFFNIIEGSRKRICLLLGIVALTAFFESIAAIYQYFAGVEALATWQDSTNLNPEQLMTRVYGTLQPYNPNLLGGYLVPTISSAIGLFFIFAVQKKVRLSVLALTISLAIIAAIVFTGSRGAYLGLLAVLAGGMLTSGHIIWHDYKDKLWLKKLWLFVLIAGVVLVFFMVFSCPSLQHRVASIFAFREDSSNSFRLNVYLASFKMFLDNWIIGIGPGNETFRLIYGQYMKSGFDALAAYSVPLEIAIESGIFALFTFVWLVASVLLKGIKTVLSNSDIEQKIIILTCVIGITAILVHGLVDTIFFRPQVQVLFWLFLAIAGSKASKNQV